MMEGQDGTTVKCECGNAEITTAGPAGSMPITVISFRCPHCPGGANVQITGKGKPKLRLIKGGKDEQ